MAQEPTVFIVDDDTAIRSALSYAVRAAGLAFESYADAQAFFDNVDPQRPGCLVLDVRMPGMSGLELQEKLEQHRIKLPVIFLTGHGDVSMAIRALKHGAFEFLEKPFDNDVLLARIGEAIKLDADARRRDQLWENLAARIGRLSARERAVMDGIVSGMTNREMADSLHLSVSTVEIARRQVLQALDVDSLSDLVRKVLYYRKHDHGPR